MHIARALTRNAGLDEARLAGVAAHAWQLTRLSPEKVLGLLEEVDARAGETMELIRGDQDETAVQGARR